MFSGFGGSFFGGDMFGSPFGDKFEEYFRCYPISMMPDHMRKDDANYGGKIFLPPSALNRLTMLHIRYPMLFSLNNEAKQITTNSGVLEFIAEEGRVYIPEWMMSTLQINPGQILKVSNCDLPLGSFVRIEPQSVDFLEISDPKAVLENALRKFSTLTVNDVIQIDYNNTVYGIKVLEVKPEESSKGICVVETDLETDFAPPVGYVEPERVPREERAKAPLDPSKVKKSSGTATMAKSLGYVDLIDNASKSNAFKGSGMKLSGNPISGGERKKITMDDLDSNFIPSAMPIPENQLFFGFPVVLPLIEDTEGTSVSEDSKSVFSGAGQSLRENRKRKDKNSKEFPLKNHSRSPEIIEID